MQLPTLNEPKKDLDKLSSQPIVYWGRVLKKNSVATYNQFANKINLKIDLLSHEKPKTIKGVSDEYYTYCHEWGHWIWHKRLGKGIRNVYRKRYEEKIRNKDFDNSFPSQYSRTKYTENFAELYATILVKPDYYDSNNGMHVMVLNAMQRFEPPNLALSEKEINKYV